MSIPRDPSEDLRRWLRLLVTAALAVVAVAAASALVSSAHSEAKAAPPAPVAATLPPYSSPLGLRVTSKPKQLEAYWDRDAVPIQTAVSGVMRISDGDASEVVPFDTDQLKDGHLTYQPVTNDVSLRLEVINREGQTVSESVRAVAMP